MESPEVPGACPPAAPVARLPSQDRMRRSLPRLPRSSWRHKAGPGKEATRRTPTEEASHHRRQVARRRHHPQEGAEAQAAPALQYDQFRLGVELQVAEQAPRADRVDLKKIIKLTPADDRRRCPSLLFRLGELYWEESKYYFFEANRKDDDYISAMNTQGQGRQGARQGREGGAARARARSTRKLAIEQYSEIVQKYQDFERTDEVLYFLGHEPDGDGRREEGARRLQAPDREVPQVEVPARRLPGLRRVLLQQLEGQARACSRRRSRRTRRPPSFPDSQVYGFAIYKQGWCYFNLTDYQKAMDKFKTVVLYGELAGAGAVEKDRSGKGKQARPGKEARNDYVRALRPRRRHARRGASATSARSPPSPTTAAHDDEAARQPLLRRRQGQGSGAHLQHADQGAAALARGARLPGQDRRLRAARRQQADDRPAGAPPGEDHGRRGEGRRRQGRRRTRRPSTRPGARPSAPSPTSRSTGTTRRKKTRDEETLRVRQRRLRATTSRSSPTTPRRTTCASSGPSSSTTTCSKYDKAAAGVHQGRARRTSKRMEKQGRQGQARASPASGCQRRLQRDPRLRRGGEEGASSRARSSRRHHGHRTSRPTIPPRRRRCSRRASATSSTCPTATRGSRSPSRPRNIYYDYNHFDEAVKRFADIALNYPDYKFEDGDSARRDRRQPGARLVQPAAATARR